ncbi:MAG TPA: response regulator [Casimicrobiaceae bacterium]|nr:response regulator [Casimicrobiaceae bacterium]
MRLDVLVVDDDEDIAVATCRALGRVHATRFAPSVDDALAAVAARVPDVVVSDFYMPTRNGDELLAILAERHPSVRRVLHSSQRAEDQQRFVDSGLAHAFVCKVEMDALLVTVAGGKR